MTEDKGGVQQAKKKIEDYLHLYLGCQVEFINQKEKKLNYQDFKSAFVTGVFQNLSGAGLAVQLCVDDWEEPLEVLAEEIKPVLRTLSDMSEEEAKEIGLNDLAKILYHGTQLVFSFEQVRYLLSKHFDLFNLIHKGLAIDKTTLK